MEEKNNDKSPQNVPSNEDEVSKDEEKLTQKDTETQENSTNNKKTKIAVSFHEDEELDSKSIPEDKDKIAEDELEAADYSGTDSERIEQLEDDSNNQPAENEVVADKEKDGTSEAVSADEKVDEVVSDTPETIEDAMRLQEKDEKTDDGLNDVVDEIVAKESDELLEVHDEKLEAIVQPKKPKNFRQKIKSCFSYWWTHKWLRYGTLVGIFIALVAAAFIPTSRYFVLNTFGVRVMSSMHIVDSQTGLPLENIAVKLQGVEQRSDEDGYVSFRDLKLGSSKLIIDKRGYGQIDKNITLGWGSNPLGDQPLQATGEQFTFILSDWLSGQPIIEAEAESGEDIAKSDEKGKIVLTVGDYSEDSEVKITANGYRTDTLKLRSISTGENQLKLTVAKKHVFVSNRSGKYDLYKIDADGKNEEVLMAATGQEREVPFVLPHPTKETAAYITSRDGETNQGGFVLEGLYVIDVENGESKRVTRSEQLQIIGWEGDKLIYLAVVEGVSAGNSERSQIFAYDLERAERTTLAASNYFNDVKLVQGRVYYSVADYAVPRSQAKLFSVLPDGEDRQTVVETQVWSIARTSYDKLLFNAIDLQWYELKLNDGGTAEKLDQEPALRDHRRYAISPSNENAAWVDVRDGKGVLLKVNTTSNEEEVILTKPGLSDPVYWLTDNHIVFHVFSLEESADYIVDIRGGEAQKIADVVGNRSRYFY